MKLVGVTLTVTSASLASLLPARARTARAITLVLMAALLSLSLLTPVAQAGIDPDKPTAHAAAASGGERHRDLDPDMLGDEVIDTARNLAVPLTLALIIIAFLVIQGLVDRADPRLVNTPPTRDEDMVGFE